MTVRAAPASEARPRRRLRLWRELAAGLVLFGVYALIEAFASPAREAAARRHGEQILALERALRLDAETPLNRWLADHPALHVFANYEYAITYIASAVWLLTYLYRKRPELYRWARDSFVIMNLIAFAVFAAYPVAPPRLLAGEGFVDTVRDGNTWFSWGSPLVSNANQIAAMPSLHLAWALWVSVVLACISSAWWVQGGSALHVLVTVVVILATANHYLLDAVGAAAVIWIAMALMSIFRDRPGQQRHPRVAPADAFFLHCESAAYPQHVGGVILQDYAGPADAYRDRLQSTIEATLPKLPRFTQVLSWPSRWSRPRWSRYGSADELDWAWHVPLIDVSRPGGAGPLQAPHGAGPLQAPHGAASAETPRAAAAGWAALWRAIAALQSERLPRDRPMWRWVTITGFAEGQIAAVILVHHAFSDGIGTVAQAIRTFKPVPDLPVSHGRTPGPLRRAAGIGLGLAQLATDGRAHGDLPHSDLPRRERPDDNHPDETLAERRYGGLSIPVARLRAIAERRHARVTDVLLTAVAAATRATLGDRPTPRRFRVAVPLMVRTPESAAEGNHTAAVIADVPLGPMPDAERLAEIRRQTRRLRSGSRALASRFVLSTGVALLPQPAQAWFARTVYGRRYFQAIVSNMPGPVGRQLLADGLVSAVYPILPLAPGAPLVVGGLSWNSTLHLGISADPALMGADPDGMEAFVAAIGETLDRLEGTTTAGVTPPEASTARPASAPTR